MYEIKNIEEKNWFENVFYKVDDYTSQFSFSTKPEVLKWIDDNNIDVKILLKSKILLLIEEKDPMVAKPLSSELIHITLWLEQLILIFESEDDYSLFKLTWM